MCGRYAVTRSTEELARRFAGELVPGAAAGRHNVAPGQDAPVVLGGTSRRLAAARWGFPLGGARAAINARAETLEARERFRDCLPARRCLVPADGFYEWPRSARRKEGPFLFQAPSGGLFAMAGLWEPCRGTCGTWSASFCVITVPANDLLGAVHERMPALLRLEDEERWLQEPDWDRARALLKPAKEDALRARRVGPRVNSARSEGPACWEQPAQTDLFS
ncbi:MAG TPA: SOS response-associated peptidase [Elusimicrobiota bacterium]|jgi:putative SOS response-associated peptidase YedK|nr:SOS response-associated peptidase [Elusimicrobiota bacterium]